MKRFLALLIIFSLFALPCHAAVTGSVSLANIRLSLVDGTAFVDFSAAGTLTPYLGGKLTLTDSAGKKAIGYIKAAGTGETYGPELVVNGGMETGDPPTGWVARSGATLSSVADERTGGAGSKGLNVVYGTSSQTADQSATLTVGAMYVYGGWIKNIDAGNGYLRLYDGTGLSLSATVTATSWTYTSVSYRAVNTAGNARLYVTDGAGHNVRFDDISLKQVLTPSTTGATITSTRGGTTYNWTSIEAGFNYNDAKGYTYTIVPRGAFGGLGMGIIYGF